MPATEARGQYDPHLKPDIDPGHELLKLMDRYVVTGCAIHDTSKALNWGLKLWYWAQSVGDLIIVICSIRRGVTFVRQKASLFVMHHFEGSHRRQGSYARESFLADDLVITAEVDLVATADVRWDRAPHTLYVSPAVFEVHD